MSTKKDIIVGMSGGVDSTVAVYLLQQQGYNVLGVTLQLADHYIKNKSKQSGVIEKAKAVCEKFGIEHVVADQTALFDTCVVNYFADAYLSGNTPNPCIQCNLLLKWDSLLKIADERGIKKIATGHYAKVIKEGKRYSLYKGEDRIKDQSYFLWRLTQEQLSRTIFPLGDITKEEIKKIAKDLALPQSNQMESQDVCFIPDNDYKVFLKEYFPNKLNEIKKGNFVDKDGQILGHHDGYYRFTIGQRKGLGLAMGEPVYVREIHPASNTVVIAQAIDMEDIGCTVTEMNWLDGDIPQEMKEIQVKVRYRNKGVQAWLEPLENGKYHVLFSEPVYAVTPGQSAVFYNGNKVLGGGVILSHAQESEKNEKDR
ncbi:MAG: tRNA 2-thiouridine(34) synthase MnmA [Candidatus Marinimicrobia bacterium]|nr:tRNA 2-thiouridine(34) synthase MnmA [Candidatus Neomarinimicrobiota bacterium]